MAGGGEPAKKRSRRWLRRNAWEISSSIANDDADIPVTAENADWPADCRREGSQEGAVTVPPPAPEADGKAPPAEAAAQVAPHDCETCQSPIPPTQPMSQPISQPDAQPPPSQPAEERPVPGAPLPAAAAALREDEDDQLPSCEPASLISEHVYSCCHEPAALADAGQPGWCLPPEPAEPEQRQAAPVPPSLRDPSITLAATRTPAISPLRPAHLPAFLLKERGSSGAGGAATSLPGCIPCFTSTRDLAADPIQSDSVPPPSPRSARGELKRKNAGATAAAAPRPARTPAKPKAATKQATSPGRLLRRLNPLHLHISTGALPVRQQRRLQRAALPTSPLRPSVALVQAAPLGKKSSPLAQLFQEMMQEVEPPCNAGHPAPAAVLQLQSAADLAMQAGQQLASPNHYALRPLPAVLGYQTTAIPSQERGHTQASSPLMGLPSSSCEQEAAAPAGAGQTQHGGDAADPGPGFAWDLLMQPRRSPLAQAQQIVSAASPVRQAAAQYTPQQQQQGQQQHQRANMPLPPLATHTSPQQMRSPPPRPPHYQHHQQQQQRGAANVVSPLRASVVSPPRSMHSAHTPGTGGLRSSGGGATARGTGSSPGSFAPRDFARYLPPKLCEAMLSYGKVGAELYQWQADCLTTDPGVMAGARNLVFCAPTSGGKTLVAEVLMLRRLAQDPDRKALLVLPYVSLCREKSARLRPLLEPLGKEVKESFGGQQSLHVLGRSAGVVVCTIEVANSLVNSLLGDGCRLHEEFSCVVVDELHMAGDTDRGYQLELLLNKLRYEAATVAAVEQAQQVQQQSGSGAAAAATAATAVTSPRPSSSGGTVRHASKNIQIIGMSATLPNLDDVARWLDAAAYVSDHRPVPLSCFLKVGQEMQDSGLRVARTLPPPAPGDPDHVAFLVQETVAAGHSVLVFCPTKMGCVAEAKLLAKSVQVPERCAGQQPASGGTPRGRPHVLDLADGDFSREAVATELEDMATPRSLQMAALVRHGMAFHNSDLDARQRALVEGAYRCGAVCVLCATSTLAAGVNLPARRVIFRQAYIGVPSSRLGKTSFRQMAGRAGRAGIDDEGEAILLHTRAGVPLPHLQELVAAGAVDPISSCFSDNKLGMRHAMLEIVASGAASSASDINRYMRCTLLAAMEKSPRKVAPTVRAALMWLGDPKRQAASGVPEPAPFVTWNDDSATYAATDLGEACFKAGWGLEMALQMKADLARAQKNFVMTSNLHVCFLCVSIHNQHEMRQGDWKVLHRIVESLKEDQADGKAMRHIGVNLGYVQGRALGTVVGGGDQQANRTCQRFYSACILRDMLQGALPAEVARRFGLPSPVSAAELREAAGRFARRARAFCENMGWDEMAAVISNFAAKTCPGSDSDVVSLTDIKGVKVNTAKLLYAAGLKSPRDVAQADARDVRKALNKGPPMKGHDKVESKEANYRKAAEIQENAKYLLLRLEAEGRMEVAGGQGNRKRSRGQQRQFAVVGMDAAQVAKKVCMALGMHIDPAGTSTSPLSGAADTDELQQSGGQDEEWAALAEADTALLQRQLRQAANAPVTHTAAGVQPGAAVTTAIGGSTTDRPQVQPMRLPQQQGTSTAPAQAATAAFQSRPFNADASGVQLVCALTQVQALCAMLRERRCFGADFDVVALSVVEDSMLSGLKVPKGPVRGKKKRPHSTARSAGQPPAEALPPPGTVLGLALSWADGRAAYVPLSALQEAGAATPSHQRVASELAALLAAPGVQVVGYGWKQQIAACRWLMGHAAGAAPSAAAGPDCLPAGLIDARIAAWMVAPDSGLVADGSQAPRSTNSKLYSSFGGPGARAVPPEQLLEKALGPDFDSGGAYAGLTARPGGGVGVAAAAACKTAAVARRLYEAVLPKITESGLMEAFISTEMALVPVLADMEAGGMGLHLATLLQLRSRLNRRLKDLQHAVNGKAGYTVMLTSPKEVAKLLYQQLKLAPPPGAAIDKLSKGGEVFTAYSTNKEALAALMGEHEVVPLIADHRKLTDTVKHVDALLAAAEKGPPAGGAAHALACIRGSFMQTATGTGRLTMAEPNLQCIPRPHPFIVLPSAPGAPGSSEAPFTQGGRHWQLDSNVRAAFVPAAASAVPGDRVMLSADFRQCEFRMMAHFSGDETLRSMLANGEEDPFRLLASRWKDVPVAAVTQEQRNHAKELWYAVNYGMGVPTIAAKLGVAPKEAAVFREGFLARFPGLKAWLQRVLDDCRANGYVTSLLGRRRWMPGINAEDHRARSAAERAAINTVCQASAADVAKAAMVKIYWRLQAEFPPGAARLVLQIHDELLLDVEGARVGPVAAVVRECMEGAATLEVALAVRLSVGPSWGELVELPE